MGCAIRVENLTKVFDEIVAVDNVSFEVPEHSIFGFLGPNGSGKSTTMRIICGVLSPTKGMVTIEGHNVLTETEIVKRNIGYMSQNFGLYEDLTVAENLDFYASLYGLDSVTRKARREELIKMAGLSGKDKQLAGNLSGGWKQRLGLGCALIHKPKLLILDEPTAGVDPVSRKVFWKIIQQLPKQGVTVFVSTHYMDEAENCDTIALIFNGKIVNVASPEELMKQEKTDNLEDVFVAYVEKITGIKTDPSVLDVNFLAENDNNAV